MDTLAETTLLPADIDAEPLVQAAAAFRPELVRRHGEIERAARVPDDLIERLRAAGFYRLTIPRTLGGLQVDPLTYLRVVECLAEGAASVGWNVANNGLIQLITLGLPDAGVAELYADGPKGVAGTAVRGAGRAVPVAGGYRVTGRWSFGSGCHECAWMLGSFQIFDDGNARRAPDGGALHWRGVFASSEVEILPGTWEVSGVRGTGSFDWSVDDVFLPERRTMPLVGAQIENEWLRWPGVTYA